MERAGLQPRFVQGQRVTDAATAALVDRVLSREINPEIVELIRAHGGQAQGFAGPDIFRCRPARVTGPDGAPLDLGLVGEVVEVNTAPLLECLARGVTPVISPTARGEDGQIYNCNADVAAAQTAIALRARRLVFMSDVPGLLRDPRDPATLIPHLRVTEVAALKAAGVVDKGMIPKVDSAVAAIRAGVEKVSLVDGRVPHAVLLEIFTDAGIGTEVVL
jgi:acetylglutamate kinase